MGEIQEMLAKAVRVEVLTVLFRKDFSAMAMEPTLDPALNDLEGECWLMEPQPVWTVTADNDDNMTAHSTEPYEPPACWRWVATIALVLIPEPCGPQGMCFGRGIWFPMAGINPPQQIEVFLDFLCDEMVRRANLKCDRPVNGVGGKSGVRTTNGVGKKESWEMANDYSNVLKITGPNVKLVVARIKADTPHVDKDGQTHEVYFDPQRISGSHNQVGVPHIFPDDQKIWDEDGSAVIRFDTAGYPAFYPILWLSKMFPTHTLKLKWRLQSESSDPSIVLFRAGEASHVHEIPNHNGNTGKTATLFEIFCSHINRFQDGEKLDYAIDSALAVVERVKLERLAENKKAQERGDHAEY